MSDTWVDRAESEVKVLNLYAGIGGNRKLWKNVDVVAIENDSQIATIYQKLYPNDKVIVTDAHQYLVDHYKEFNYIWSSPPCPSHSNIRRMGCNASKQFPNGQHKSIYPDMGLYQEIIFLKYYFKGKFCVENVVPYYTPLIKAKKLDRHLFWTNYLLDQKKFVNIRNHNQSMDEFKRQLGVNLNKFILDSKKKRAVYRNCVQSDIAEFVFNMAFNTKQEKLL